MTWSRAELKERAKNVLRRGYWLPFAASLVYSTILSFASGGSSGGSGATATANLNLSSGTVETSQPVADLEQVLTELFAGMELAEVLSVAAIAGLAFTLALIVGILMSYVLQFFVIAPLNVGYSRYYMVNRTREAQFGELFAGFKTRYLNVAAGQFVTTLFISLWSLLLIVPGIIYGYKWRQVRYILAENPNLSGKRAREISDAMTMNEKWDMFVLDWSFFGWQLLGALCCGIGGMFLAPYEQATFAELYAVQREKVLAAGLATAEELPGV